MLFISVKSSAAAFVPKVLQVVEETKRVRYKAGRYPETFNLLPRHDVLTRSFSRRLGR
jgi:hypothetical protein